MTILVVIITFIILWFVWSNLKVAKANKLFYDQLVKKGISHEEAKSIIKIENINYQERVKAGEKGLMLNDHLKEVADQY